jgi:hypothetical protein
MMHGDRTVSDSNQLQLPPDLVAELQRRGTAPKVELQMGEHWRPSLLSRIFSLFSTKRSR